MDGLPGKNCAAGLPVLLSMLGTLLQPIQISNIGVLFKQILSHWGHILCKFEVEQVSNFWSGWNEHCCFILKVFLLWQWSWRYEYLLHHSVVQLDTILDGFFKLQFIGSGIIQHESFWVQCFLWPLVLLHWGTLQSYKPRTYTRGVINPKLLMSLKSMS